MEVIAVWSIKGGVGKTTTAVNLAYRSAAEDWPTVLWDLDSQGAASYLLRREARSDGRTKRLIRGDTPLVKAAVATDHPRLDLLPADFSYRRMDSQLQKYDDAATRLLSLLRPLEQRYACLILDCPPGMSLVAENVIHGADALVVPVLPSPLSARMLEQLYELVAARHDFHVLPFFSMVDRRKSLHRETMAQLRASFRTILATEVPYGSDFERVAARRAPIESYAPANAAATVYRALWAEIDARMGDAAALRQRREPSETSDAANESGRPVDATENDVVGRPWSTGRA